MIDGGVFLEAETRALLCSAGRWPVRNVDQNLADLRAQVAATPKGEQELRDLIARWGLPTVRALHGLRAGQRRGRRCAARSARSMTATMNTGSIRAR